MIDSKKRQKAAILDSVFGNENTMSVIAEALKEPIGSTKRKKALSLFRVLGGRPNDGVGGAFDFQQVKIPQTGGEYEGPYDPTFQKDASKMIMQDPSVVAGKETDPFATSTKVFFPSAPDMKIRQTTVPIIEKKTKDIKSDVATSTPSGVDDISSDIEGINFGDGSSQFPGAGTAGTMVTGDSGYDSWYEGLSDDDKTRYADLYGALKAGIGKKTFAWQMISDVEKMKTLFPGAPAEALPIGASLASQVNDIEKNLREEYKIDVLTDNLNKLQNRGIDIEEDLTSYITARDSYIEKLDGMIGKAKDSMTTLDMANPYVAKQMGNYMNYLYIMKGRQQKRYADFLKSAITYHNNEVKRAKDSYDTANKQFTDVLANKKEILKEDYTNLKALLEEMYENVDNREKKILTNALLQQKVAELALQNAVDPLDASGSTGWNNASKATKTKAEGTYYAQSGLPPEQATAEWANMTGTEKLSWAYKSKSSSGLNNDIDDLFE